MGKDILSFNIPLDTCGVAGLGVTVHGSKKKQSGGDMGIYIKSIVPGGAAAQVSLVGGKGGGVWFALAWNIVMADTYFKYGTMYL